MKIIKSHCKIVTNVCCAVAVFLMIPIIIMNTSLAVQRYILKEEVPNVCGYFPIISLEEEPSIHIEKGDFIICKKFDEDTDPIDEWTAGSLVTHFADVSRSKMCIAPFVSADGDHVTLLSPRDKGSYELPPDNIIGEYRFSIPLLGGVIYFLSTIPGFLICVVIPTIVFTELYLYQRRKDFASEEEEESILLATREALKEERESLLSQIEKNASEMDAQNSNS